MNGFAVQDAWLKYLAEQRRGGRPAASESVRSAEERRLAAKVWIEENVPDLGCCPYAAVAAIDLRDRGLPVNPDAVRHRRDNWRMYDGRTLAEWDQEASST